VNYTPGNAGSALPEPIDLLLADIAIRVQLSRTDYDKAVARFEVMREWIDRPGSPLRGLVGLMYPQGSMAIGATVARVGDRDEYDVDLIVGLLLPPDSDPELVLSTLYDAIRGEPGSRYYDKTVRHTRCVCVSYEDGMHTDLTPAVLVTGGPARTSVIFHSKPEEGMKLRLLANPWGFGEWFKETTPLEANFAKLYEARAEAYKRAPAEPVPEQEPAGRKSRALISLQLTKRWRNVLFARRDRARLRRPPSVLLSKLFADNANGTTAADAEDLDAFARHVVGDEGLNDCQRGWIVRPDAAVDQLVSAGVQCAIDGWCCRRREGDVDHTPAPILFVVPMVPGLEQEDFAEPAVERGNHEPDD
jgi:hypothetical protein